MKRVLASDAMGMAPIMMTSTATATTTPRDPAARPYADFDARLGGNEQAAKNLLRVAYSSLKQ
jgi:hypothetical protein